MAQDEISGNQEQRQEAPQPRQIEAASAATTMSREGNSSNLPADRTQSRSASDALPGVQLVDQAGRARIEVWQGQTDQIVKGVAADTEKGGRVQAGVFRSVEEALKTTGLHEQGWRVLPSIPDSALDKAGGDMVVINRKTGDYFFVDATSADKSQQDLSRFHKQGIIKAENSFFGETGKLDKENAKAKAFQKQVEHDLKQWTQPQSNGGNHKLNMAEVPLPGHIPSSKTVAELSAFQKSLGDAVKRTPQSERAAVIDELAKKEVLRGQNQDERVKTQNTPEAQAIKVRVVDQAASRAVLESVVSTLTNKPIQLGERPRTAVHLAKSGEIIATNPADGKQLTGGSPQEAIQAGVDHWLLANKNSPEGQKRREELEQRLKKSGVTAEQFLSHLSVERHRMAMGGPGTEKPVYKLLDAKLATYSNEQVAKIINNPAEALAEPAPIAKPGRQPVNLKDFAPSPQVNEEHIRAVEAHIEANKNVKLSPELRQQQTNIAKLIKDYRDGKTVMPNFGQQMSKMAARLTAGSGKFTAAGALILAPLELYNGSSAATDRAGF